jgi:flagellar biogenesis protein FliO
MRREALQRIAMIMFMAPIMVSAQAFGTKKNIASPVQSTSAAPGLPPILPTLLALGIVWVLIKWGLPSLMKTLQKKSQSDGMISVRESATVGTNQVHIVSTMGRTLLIGSSPTGMTVLADLTEPVPANSSPELFGDVLFAETQRPNVAPFTFQNEEEPDPQKVNEALARLERLFHS